MQGTGPSRTFIAGGMNFSSAEAGGADDFAVELFARGLTEDGERREHSWYFRNALVRANYRNVREGIEPEPAFLERFFRKLLAGEQNELKNRFMLIDPPEQLADKHPTSTRQAPDKYSLGRQLERCY